MKYKRCCGRPQGATTGPRRKPQRIRGLAGATIHDVAGTQTGNKEVVVAAMRNAGVRPAIIYAYEQTGLWITELNRPMQMPENLAAWDAAIDEYNARRDQDGSDNDPAEAGPDSDESAG
jgi:hypothetical protein